MTAKNKNAWEDKLSTTVAIGRCVLFTCAISGLLGIAPASTARAQEPNLSGKTVEFVIPFAESGGSAQWANFLAPLPNQRPHYRRKLWAPPYKLWARP